MKTARQILRSFFHWETEDEFNEQDKNIPEASSIYGAMEEYAKQQAIEFGKWLVENYYVNSKEGWYQSYSTVNDHDLILLTDKQLYKKFKNENTATNKG